MPRAKIIPNLLRTSSDTKKSVKSTRIIIFQEMVERK